MTNSLPPKEKKHAVIKTISKSPSIPIQVAEQIIALIKSGNMQQGDLLASEEVLTADLGISRITLREAKKLLEARGYIQSHGKGRKYISSPEHGEKTSIQDLVSLDPEKLWEILAVRKILDTEAAVIACSTATAKEKKALRSLCSKAIELGFGDRLPITEEGSRLYLDFFEALVNTTHNTMFSYLRKSMNSILTGSLPYSRKKLSSIQGSSKSIIEQLCTIVAAIENRNPDAARSSMIHHLEYIEKALKRGRDHP